MPNEKRIVIFTICCEVPFIPTDEQNTMALAMICRVVSEGMKLDILSASIVSMTEEQARKNAEKLKETEVEEAVEEAKEHLKS